MKRRITAMLIVLAMLGSCIVVTVGMLLFAATVSLTAAAPKPSTTTAFRAPLSDTVSPLLYRIREL